MKKQKEVKFRKDKKFRFKGIPIELHVTNDGFTLWVTDFNGNTSHWLLDASCLTRLKYINLGNTNIRTKKIDSVLTKVKNDYSEQEVDGNFKIKIRGI